MINFSVIHQTSDNPTNNTNNTYSNNNNTPPVITAEIYNKLITLLNKKNTDNIETFNNSDFSYNTSNTSTFFTDINLYLISSNFTHHLILNNKTTNHIIPNLHFFTSSNLLPNPYYISLPNNTQTLIKHIKSVIL